LHKTLLPAAQSYGSHKSHMTHETHGTNQDLLLNKNAVANLAQVAHYDVITFNDT
jgi:hypothetical protein